MPVRDAVYLAALSALALVGVVVCYVVTGTVPSVLDAGLTALIGATAGVAYGTHSTATNAGLPPDLPPANGG